MKRYRNIISTVQHNLTLNTLNFVVVFILNLTQESSFTVYCWLSVSPALTPHPFDNIKFAKILQILKGKVTNTTTFNALTPSTTYLTVASRTTVASHCICWMYGKWSPSYFSYMIFYFSTYFFFYLYILVYTSISPSYKQITYSDYRKYHLPPIHPKHSVFFYSFIVVAVNIYICIFACWFCCIVGFCLC